MGKKPLRFHLSARPPEIIFSTIGHPISFWVFWTPNTFESFAHSESMASRPAAALCWECLWSIPSRPDPAPLDLIPYPALYPARSRYIQTLACSLDQLRFVTRSSIYYNKLQRLFQQKETKLAVNKISGMQVLGMNSRPFPAPVPHDTVFPPLPI